MHYRDEELKKKLDLFDIKYHEDSMGSYYGLFFDVSENDPRWEEIQQFLPPVYTEEENEERARDINSPIINTKADVLYIDKYTEEECREAKWFLLEPLCDRVDPKNEDTLYEEACMIRNPMRPDPIPDDVSELRKSILLSRPLEIGRHLVQAEPYEITKTIKWGTRNFFYTTYFGWMKLFCSDVARQILDKSGLTGIRYIPVLKYKKKTIVPDMHQLTSEYVIPAEAFVPIQNYIVDTCEICHKQMLIRRPRSLLGVYEKYLDETIDFYTTDPIFCPDKECPGYSLNIVSNRMYRTIKDNHMEKNLRFAPLILK